MTNLEFIAKLMQHIAHTPALGECEADISIAPGDTMFDVNYDENLVEIEGAR